MFLTHLRLHMRQTIKEGTQVLWLESVHRLQTFYFTESFDEPSGAQISHLLAYGAWIYSKPSVTAVYYTAGCSIMAGCVFMMRPWTTHQFPKPQSATASSRQSSSSAFQLSSKTQKFALWKIGPLHFSLWLSLSLLWCRKQSSSSYFLHRKNLDSLDCVSLQ